MTYQMLEFMQWSRVNTMVFIYDNMRLDYISQCHSVIHDLS